MKSRNVVFRVDPGTYRQIEAEAKRRGLSVSAYARLMCTLPFIEAGPPDGRAVNQELKEAIAAIHAVPEQALMERYQTFKTAVETVIAAQSSLDVSARWLVNVANTLFDLRAEQKGEPPDASASDQGNPDTLASR